MPDDDDYFDYSEAEPASENDTSTGERWNFNWGEVQAFLQYSVEEEQRRLELELERIYEQLDDRMEVHEETVDRIESKISEYVKDLDKELNRPFAGREEQREELREKIGSLYDDLSASRTRFWNDVQRLHREKREVLRKLDEAEGEEDLSDLL